MIKETYQCTTCGEVFNDPSELDEQDDCEACADAYHAKTARYWRGRWDAERYGDAAIGGDLA